jgi:hypothetical protein
MSVFLIPPLYLLTILRISGAVLFITIFQRLFTESYCEYGTYAYDMIVIMKYTEGVKYKICAISVRTIN